jgi:type IV pilus assembly protein PilC
MPTYRYDAINESGHTVSGALEADSFQTANAILSDRGLIPSKVVLKKDDSRDNMWVKIKAMTGTVKTNDLILFTKQFRSMLNAGIPILRIMQVLEAQTESKVLREAISAIIEDIKQGSTISESFEKYPRIFSNLYCSMLRAGEISGNVPSVLERLIYIIEHEARIKSDIKAAMQYPLIVVIALGIAFFVLLTFVIPQFVAIFSSAGIELPLPTKIAVSLHLYIKNYWFLILGVIAATIVATTMYFRTPGGKVVRDSFLLSLPVLGPLFQKAAMSRFASIFAILQTSGVPVMQALTILSGTIGNAAISKQFDYVRDRIEEGAGIATPLKSAKYFPPMVIDMIAIGEESGNIDEMLREISKHYDDEVAYAVKGLSDAIGPLLIVGLAAVVGFFALAIFLPMWDMTKIATGK